MNRRKFMARAACIAIGPLALKLPHAEAAAVETREPGTFPVALAEPLRHQSISEIIPDLARFRSKGYTGIWIENDYVRWTNKPDPDQGFGGCWRLFNIFDFTYGPSRDRYIGYLKQLSDVCVAYGLEIWSSFWIPLPNDELMVFLRQRRPGAIGQATIDGKRIPTLCTCSSGQGIVFLREMVDKFLETFPQVRGLKIATGDNSSTICDATCPNAHGTTQAQHAGNLFGTVDRALHASSQGGCLMLYPWYWGKGFKEEILAQLQGDYLVMTKMEQNSIQPIFQKEGGDPIFDDSIVSEQAGPDFEEWLKQVGPQRIIDMVPTGSGVDDMFFNFPPYPSRLYRRFRKLRSLGVQRFLDYECGGHNAGSNEEAVALFSQNPNLKDEEVLSAIAARLYRNQQAQEHAITGWRHFDTGFGQLPIGLGHTDSPQFSGRFGFAWPMCIATPLLPEKISTKDRWHEIFWFSPYNFFRPQTTAPLERQFKIILTEWGAGAEHLSKAYALEKSVASEREYVALRAHVLGVKSALNWCNAAAMSDGSDHSGDNWKALYAKELKLATEFQDLRSKYPWVWANNCWHPLQTPLHQKGIGFSGNDTDPFTAKIRILQERLDQQHNAEQFS